jgi:hypothetical protein
VIGEMICIAHVAWKLAGVRGRLQTCQELGIPESFYVLADQSEKEYVSITMKQGRKTVTAFYFKNIFAAFSISL